jgi:hypothetical protein
MSGAHLGGHLGGFMHHHHHHHMGAEDDSQRMIAAAAAAAAAAAVASSDGPQLSREMPDDGQPQTSRHRGVCWVSTVGLELSGLFCMGAVATCMEDGPRGLSGRPSSSALDHLHC